ncbi:MAG: 4Fe-4S binding protein [Deltaproteobacteria bacterium]|nr:4Fe-4S binding protein [Deltaproteobacteria bacterium]
MTGNSNICYVKTVPDRCRVCYTCVRECPAKSIRINEGQAQVIPERCINCGNCVRVCSQGAKQIVTAIDAVEELLRGPDPVAACIAPSFPVEFMQDYEFRVLVGMIRKLGFKLVTEVAFGADLVAERYRRFIVQNKKGQWISSSCPAVVGFVERYHKDLTDKLVPIVSPMIAMARILHHIHGKEMKIVFIGPCVAKKAEARSNKVAGEVDEVLTFSELREMFEKNKVDPQSCEPSNFDPPRPALGAVFPMSSGILRAAGISEDLVTNDVVATAGIEDFVSALEEFASGNLDMVLLDLLCCSGCIMGPGITSRETILQRRTRLGHYVDYRLRGLDKGEWYTQMTRLAGLDLSRTFDPKIQTLEAPPTADIRKILERMGKFTPQDELNCGACGYATCREHAIAISRGLAETEMCLPYTIDELRQALKEVEASHARLQDAQEALMHSEKLASLGQLAAGIAHEVNNPLGVVLMYAHVLLDECPADSSMSADLQMIAEQADRCKTIVAGLLDFARQNRVVLQPVDIRDVVSQGLAATPVSEGISVVVQNELEDPTVEIDKDQIVQVVMNIASNAFAAMSDGGRLTIRIRQENGSVFLDFIDTGVGIAKENINKIFEPFFTTKQIGKGTGLGLAVVYGIVKMHRGDISVESNADALRGPTGTVFRIRLPRRGQNEDAA